MNQDNRKSIIINNTTSYVDYVVGMINFYEKGYRIEYISNNIEDEINCSKGNLYYWKPKDDDESFTKDEFCLQVDNNNDPVLIGIENENKYSFDIKIIFLDRGIISIFPVAQKVTNDKDFVLMNRRHLNYSQKSKLDNNGLRPLNKSINAYLNNILLFDKIYKSGFFTKFYDTVFQEMNINDIVYMEIKKLPQKISNYYDFISNENIFNFDLNNGYDKVSILINNLEIIRKIYSLFWNQKKNAESFKLINEFKNGINFHDFNFYVGKNSNLIIKFCGFEILNMMNINVFKYMPSYQINFLINMLLKTNTFNEFTSFCKILKLKSNLLK